MLSQDGSVVAIAGSHDVRIYFMLHSPHFKNIFLQFSLLSYPSLIPISESVHTEREIYDVTFSANQVCLFQCQLFREITIYKVVIATTHNLLVYALPGLTAAPLSSPVSPKKSKKNSKTSQNDTDKLSTLKLEHTVELPSSTGEGSTFRAAR